MSPDLAGFIDHAKKKTDDAVRSLRSIRSMRQHMADNQSARDERARQKQAAKEAAALARTDPPASDHRAKLAEAVKKRAPAGGHHVGPKGENRSYKNNVFNCDNDYLRKCDDDYLRYRFFGFDCPDGIAVSVLVQHLDEMDTSAESRPRSSSLSRVSRVTAEEHYTELQEAIKKRSQRISAREEGIPRDIPITLEDSMSMLGPFSTATSVVGRLNVPDQQIDHEDARSNVEDEISHLKDEISHLMGSVGTFRTSHSIALGSGGTMSALGMLGLPSTFLENSQATYPEDGSMGTFRTSLGSGGTMSALGIGLPSTFLENSQATYPEDELEEMEDFPELEEVGEAQLAELNSLGTLGTTFGTTSQLDDEDDELNSLGTPGTTSQLLDEDEAQQDEAQLDDEDEAQLAELIDDAKLEELNSLGTFSL